MTWIPNGETTSPELAKAAKLTYFIRVISYSKCIERTVGNPSKRDSRKQSTVPYPSCSFRTVTGIWESESV